MIGLDILLIIKKIIFHKNLVDNIIYYSGWFFGTALLISILINYSLFMSDIIGDSWHNLRIHSFISLLLINLFNPIVTFILFYSTKKHLEIKDTSFILHKIFSKITIEFSDIDTKKSEYIFVVGKSSRLFPKKNIFEQKEYLLLQLNNGVIIKINLNFLLFSGNKTLLFTTIVKKLKIDRKIVDK